MHCAKAVSELEASSLHVSWAVVYIMRPVTEEQDYLWTHICVSSVSARQKTLCTNLFLVSVGTSSGTLKSNLNVLDSPL